MAAALADHLGQIFLRIAVTVHQQPIAFSLLDRVQVFALNVLDDGNLDRFLVGERAHHHRQLVQIGALRRPPATISYDSCSPRTGRTTSGCTSPRSRIDTASSSI